jgi:hypothetical protein
MVSPTSSVSWCDSGSTMTLVAPRLNSMWKSKPRSLLVHWCCGMVDNLWSRKNLRVVVSFDDERVTP